MEVEMEMAMEKVVQHETKTSNNRKKKIEELNPMASVFATFNQRPAQLFKGPGTVTVRRIPQALRHFSAAALKFS